MGSVTPTEEITKRHDYLEINTANACKISGNKIKMKKRFWHANVITPEWFTISRGDVQYNIKNGGIWFSEKFINKLKKYKTIIAKRYNSSGGNMIYLISSINDFNDFITNAEIDKNHREIENYVFEKYYTYSREYRIHVTKEGCFLADRKMLIDGAENRWHRHENNSVWISEDNPKFDKPTNWDRIVEDCVFALKSEGLDIAAFDVKVQNNKHKTPKWVILESNSAPGLGERSVEIYKNIITKITNG